MGSHAVCNKVQLGAVVGAGGEGTRSDDRLLLLLRADPGAIACGGACESSAELSSQLLDDKFRLMHCSACRRLVRVLLPPRGENDWTCALRQRTMMKSAVAASTKSWTRSQAERSSVEPSHRERRSTVSYTASQTAEWIRPRTRIPFVAGSLWRKTQ